ncbi:hypothetical protein BaRGS_00038116, partial [Batillaria attramentaria]
STDSEGLQESHMWPIRSYKAVTNRISSVTPRSSDLAVYDRRPPDLTMVGSVTSACKRNRMWPLKIQGDLMPRMPLS